MMPHLVYRNDPLETNVDRTGFMSQEVQTFSSSSATLPRRFPDSDIAC
jgi:hypothetical protein